MYRPQINNPPTPKPNPNLQTTIHALKTKTANEISANLHLSKSDCTKIKFNHNWCGK